MRIWIKVLTFLIGTPVWAASPEVSAIVDTHVIPGYSELVTQTAKLAEIAEMDCTPTSPALRSAYSSAFDVWISVGHLRFGPSEQNDRAFALAFWPDPRSSTPKALAMLFRDLDPIIYTHERFQSVSIAARGFYALEFLLFDPLYLETPEAAYRCTLIKAITTDMATNAIEILMAWNEGYDDLMRQAGSNSTYQSDAEAVQQLFTALTTGLEFTSATRLGRPMGTFDQPRPNRKNIDDCL